MQRIGFFFFRIIIFGFSITPFWLLYIYSDLFRILMLNIVKYRRKVVIQNLKNAFPEKDNPEIKSIVKKFYRNLCDILLESLKGSSVNKRSKIKRLKVINPEVADRFYREGKSIIAYSAHYANWEWAAISFGYQYLHKCIALYKPLKNKYIDSYSKKIRAVGGMHMVSINNTYKTFSEQHEKPAIFFMVSDQSPSNIEKAIWVNFLNQDTACLHGGEYYARKFNMPVIYFDIQRVKRGYYEVFLTKLFDQPLNTEEKEITRSYMKFVENIIRKKPEDWLWSHNRWKHKKNN